MIPVRYKAGEPRVVSSDKRLNAGHPLVGTPCPACDVPLAPGEPVALVYIGPGPDPEDQEKEREGRWFTGAAVVVHVACAGVGTDAGGDS